MSAPCVLDKKIQFLLILLIVQTEALKLKTAYPATFRNFEKLVLRFEFPENNDIANAVFTGLHQHAADRTEKNGACHPAAYAGSGGETAEECRMGAECAANYPGSKRLDVWGEPSPSPCYVQRFYQPRPEQFPCLGFSNI